MENQLRYYRKSHALTQRQLSEDIGINPATLSRIETCEGYQTVRRIIGWCHRHRIDPALFFPPEPANE